MPRRASLHSLALVGAALLTGGVVAAQDVAPAGSFTLAVEGVSLPLHLTDPGYDYGPHLAELPPLGASHVVLVVHFWQEHARSPAPARDPQRDLSDASLLRAIGQARKLDLEVILLPMLLLRAPGPNEWRAKLAPPEWGAWFEGYERVLLHYARLAQEAGVSALVVGSELSSSEPQLARWRGLIRRVRAAFGGGLTYGANWDHYRRVGFWNDLDWVGLSAYYELSRADAPTQEELTAAWGKVREELLFWRQEAGIRPRLLFLELGYPSLQGCAAVPWDYTRKAPVDLETQRRCYQAFEQAWAGRAELAGVVFWEWWPPPGGPEDRSYTPRGKPALEVIKRMFAAPGLRPPGAPAPPR